MFSYLTDAGKGWYQILHVGCYNEPAVPGKGQLKKSSLITDLSAASLRQTVN